MRFQAVEVVSSVKVYKPRLLFGSEESSLWMMSRRRPGDVGRRSMPEDNPTWRMSGDSESCRPGSFISGKGVDFRDDGAGEAVLDS